MLMIFFLAAIFLVLLIGYNIVVQYKRSVAEKKLHDSKRIQKHTKLIESLLSYSNKFPFTQELTLCLQQRLLDNAVQLKELALADSNRLNNYILSLEEIIQKNKTHYEPSVSEIKLPETDELIADMIQSIKKLRHLLRHEHKQGYISAELYINENKKLESLHLQINIESIFKRINSAKEEFQYINAIQITNKALEALSTKNLPDAINACNDLNLMKEELEKLLVHQDMERTERIQQKEKRHVDSTFEVKKKW